MSLFEPIAHIPLIGQPRQLHDFDYGRKGVQFSRFVLAMRFTRFIIVHQDRHLPSAEVRTQLIAPLSGPLRIGGSLEATASEAPDIFLTFGNENPSITIGTKSLWEA